MRQETMLRRSLVLATLVLFATSPMAWSDEPTQPGNPPIIERLEFSEAGATSYEPPELMAAGRSSMLRGNDRCGTPVPSREVKDRFDSVMATWETASSVTQKKGKIKVPVVFWVIQNDAGAGAVSESQLYSQLDVLNWAYRNSGISFNAHSGWMVTSNKYHKKCQVTKKGKLNPVYKKMTKKLTKAGKVDPAKTLNLYICDPKGKTLGEAFAAWLLEGTGYDESDYLNGVVVDYRTLPGGSLYPYNAGTTAAHEIGHYFGLYHTFSPNEYPGMTGCDYPGDFIDDTPYEKTPAYDAVPENNCAKGRDTCKQHPKKDPVTNFMDYSSDYCQVKFSGQQKKMMNAVIEYYRPSLMR